jgi:hypothetical protein
MKALFAAFLLIVASSSAVHASGSRAYAMKKCTFRNHMWSVVYDTNNQINFLSGLTTHAGEQNWVARMQEKVFRIESRYGSPYGSETLLSDLTNTWVSIESAGFDMDQENAADPNGNPDMQQVDYWDVQFQSDVKQAWASQAYTWKDVKATC